MCDAKMRAAKIVEHAKEAKSRIELKPRNNKQKKFDLSHPAEK